MHGRARDAYVVDRRSLVGDYGMTSASKGLRSEGTAATRVVLLNHSFHHHRIPFEACFFFCVLVVVCVFLISEVGFFFFVVAAHNLSINYKIDENRRTSAFPWLWTPLSVCFLFCVLFCICNNTPQANPMNIAFGV